MGVMTHSISCMSSFYTFIYITFFNEKSNKTDSLKNFEERVLGIEILSKVVFF